MSKKSRRRNKKILAALALAGGAAMLGRKKGSIADMDDAGINVTHPALTAKNYITKKVTDAAPSGSDFQSRFKTKIGNKWVGPGEASGIADRVTSVSHPILGHSTAKPNRFGTLYKKGGRVTGIAKRGFGRALMKGKK